MQYPQNGVRSGPLFLNLLTITYLLNIPFLHTLITHYFMYIEMEFERAQFDWNYQGFIVHYPLQYWGFTMGFNLFCNFIFKSELYI